MSDTADAFESRGCPRNRTQEDKNIAEIYSSNLDLGRYNSDGSICFLGRRDSQVKIRGQRFELGEPERVLADCRDVEDICTASNIYKGRTVLVAVVSLQDPQFPRQKVLQELSFPHVKLAAQYLGTVRSFAGIRLPPYMVPTMWIVVEKMPQTSSTKLDRAAVIEWVKSKDLSSAGVALDAPEDLELTPPATDQEQLVQSIWASVLDIPRGTIGQKKLLPPTGGDSILAMQAANRCQKYGISITGLPNGVGI